jgi:hypothetical protein
VGYQPRSSISYFGLGTELPDKHYVEGGAVLVDSVGCGVFTSRVQAEKQQLSRYRPNLNSLTKIANSLTGNGMREPGHDGRNWPGSGGILTEISRRRRLHQSGALRLYLTGREGTDHSALRPRIQNVMRGTSLAVSMTLFLDTLRAIAVRCEARSYQSH